MSVIWINKNENLSKGISLINLIDTEKFGKLLQRIVKSENDVIFTPQELTKLAETFQLKPDEVQILVKTLSYIFKQSSKVMLKPTILQKQLVENLNFKEEKAEEFVKLWTSKTKENFDNLDNRNKVDEISWELNVQTSSNCTKGVAPKARIKLGTTKVGSSKKENIVFELNEEEIVEMYNACEDIQNMLDMIQANSTK